MARTQKNKATSSHLGSLKAKLAKLRRELLAPAAGAGGGGKGDGFDVNKVGDARVGLVGFPVPAVTSKTRWHFFIQSWLDFILFLSP